MTIDKPSRGIFLLLVAVVLYLTLSPSPPHVALDNLPYGDKIEHFTAFAALALMARLGFPRAPDWLLLEHLSFLGAMIEVVQATPTLQRDCDWHDWLADTMGALIMLAAVRFFRHRRRTRARAMPPVTLH
jgi:VanZ family protein